MAERLQRFTAYYDTLKQRLGTLQIADMRYPNGFTLVGDGRIERHGPTEAAGRKS
jgi:cell division septal protein FtsQ